VGTSKAMIDHSKGLVRETFITAQFCFCVNDYLLINNSKIKNIYEIPETKKYLNYWMHPLNMCKKNINTWRPEVIQRDTDTFVEIFHLASESDMYK